MTSSSSSDSHPTSAARIRAGKTSRPSFACFARSNLFMDRPKYQKPTGDRGFTDSGYGRPNTRGGPVADKTDALKERYEKFGKGDLEGALDMWTDDFVWEGSSSEDLPGAGRVEGKKEAVEKLQHAIGAWDKF